MDVFLFRAQWALSIDHGPAMNVRVEELADARNSLCAFEGES